jgi:hypothetical protein
LKAGASSSLSLFFIDAIESISFWLPKYYFFEGSTRREGDLFAKATEHHFKVLKDNALIP